MRRNIFYALLLCACCLFACKPAIEQELPYLEVETEMINTLTGDGDQFNLVIRSNVSWELSCDADWVILEQTSGTGDAVVVGAVKRGVQDSDRNCSIFVEAKECSLRCEVRLQQGKFEPVIYTLTIADIVKVASLLEDGASEEMVEFSEVNAQVASDNAAGNGPEGYVVITDDGKNFIRLVTDETYAAGSMLHIDMSGAKATRISSGNYALSGAAVTATEGVYAYSPAQIDPDAVASFENQLVTVVGTQCHDDFVNAKWSGEVKMVSVKDTSVTFTAKVKPAAGFAGETVPDNSGNITGIVVNGCLQPRNLADIALTEARVGAAEEVKTWAPIPMLFKSSAANVADNLTINGTEVTFSAAQDYSVGGKITFGGGLTTVKFGSAVMGSGYANTYITSVNWKKDAFVQVEMPVTHEISGDAEFYMHFTCGKVNVMPKFSFEWSLDGNNWNKMNAIYSYGTLTRAAAETAGQKNEFSVPTVTTYQQGTISGEFTLENPVSSGNIYFKVTALGDCTSATQTLRMNVGTYLSMKTVDNDLSGASVLASENFENCRWGANPVQGAFVGSFAMIIGTNVPTTYASSTGWTATTSMVRKGCLLISATSGDNWFISPALSMLTAPTDVTVTFKFAPYVQAAGVIEECPLSVKITGAGALQDELVLSKPIGEDPYNWHTGTFQVSGANADTQIYIGAENTSNQRFYIDDVVIKR